MKNVIISLVALAIVVGAFYYARRTGFNECKAEQLKAEKELAHEEAQMWADRPRNVSDAVMRLRARAEAKHKARIQRISR